MSSSSMPPAASPGAMLRSDLRVLLQNVGLFLGVLLPGAALAGMVAENLRLFGRAPNPAWEVGLDPGMWLVVTAPWIVPTVVLVPVIQLVGRELARRFSWRMARSVVIASSTGMFPAGVAACFGPHNVDAPTLVPLAFAAFLYGIVIRIPHHAAT